MKNIAVSVDEETYRLARIRAAELDTSVSDLVRNYLKSLVADRAGGTAPNEPDVETEAERRRRMLREVIADMHAASSGFKAADNLSREEISARVRTGPLEDAVASIAEECRLRMGSAKNGRPCKPDDLTRVVFRRR